MKKTAYFIVLSVIVAGIVSTLGVAIYQNQVSADTSAYTGGTIGAITSNNNIVDDSSSSGGNAGASVGTGTDTTTKTDTSSSGKFDISTSALTANPFPTTYGPSDPQQLADNVVKLLAKIAGSLMIIVLLYAGVLYISSAGNEEQMKKALSVIKFAIIGMIVVLMAYYIIEFVLNLVY